MTSNIRILALVVTIALVGCTTPEKATPTTDAAAKAQSASPPELSESEEKALTSAMSRFVAALKAEDIESFATLFPQKGVWTFESTLGDGNEKSVHSLTDLRRDLSQRNGLYESFFEGDGDSIRDFVESTSGRPWQRNSGQQFSPPDLPDIKDLMFIRWRLENGFWVVDTVAAPFA